MEILSIETIIFFSSLLIAYMMFVLFIVVKETKIEVPPKRDNESGKTKSFTNIFYTNL